MSSNYRQQLETWLKDIEVYADKVLDVGGSQYPIKGRTDSWDVKDYKILDLKQPHECKRKPNIIWDLNENIKADGNGTRDITNGGKFVNFNILFCLEVMEYIWDPIICLNNLNRLMKDGAILYISFPTIYPHHNPYGEDCLRYTRWGVEKLLSKTGFEIEELTPRKAKHTNFNWLWEFYMKEGMRPAKNFDGHIDIGYLVKAKKI